MLSPIAGSGSIDLISRSPAVWARADYRSGFSVASGKVDFISTVHVPPHVVFHDLAGEAVLLNLESGKYYGLDAVGTRMFALLKENGRLDITAHALYQEYDVAEEQLRGDLIKLVDDLVAHGLLIIDVA